MLAAAELVVAAFLFTLSAIFSAVETSIVSLSRANLRRAVREKVSGAATILALLKKPHELVCSFIIGYNLCNMCSSILIAHATWSLFGGRFGTIITASYIIMVICFAEMLPKTAGIKNEKIAFKFASVAKASAVLFTPLSRIITKLIGVVVGNRDLHRHYAGITKSELEELVCLAGERGVLTRREVSRIRAILKARSKKRVAHI